ncbi:hypothetical protein [Microscilla marina]|uniref:Uncharacterized protein n=1 Tax=Microscilla marina ATCC 23134 TaxID=313606 RepID=A1ZMF5_MICM2|nr:hypothetical protein [Microscilla marina]EAY28335.1 hypothetical protein M23134_03887 [Microscilla marina ATCC 23134]
MGNQLKINLKKAIQTSFHTLCHQLLIEGYSAMLKERDEAEFNHKRHKELQNLLGDNTCVPPLDFDFKEWGEEDISETLLEKMQIQPMASLHKISVQREYYLSRKEATSKKTSAKEARRIDFHFSNWTEENEKKYFAEAKNVSCNDWAKKSGAKIQASNTVARYIATGIKALVDEKYEKIQGCMLAYVVNGLPSDAVEKLNKKLQKDSLPPKYGLIENKHTIQNYEECYSSNNPNAPINKTIKHIFLKFS